MSGSRRKPGPLGPFVDGYRARLLELGYSPVSVTKSLIALGHLGRWMNGEELDVADLGGDALEMFLAAYVTEHGRRPSSGVRPLLVYMRSEGVVAPEPVLRLGPLDRLVGEYRTWLTVERELSSETVRGYTHLAHRFLAERASTDNELGVERLAGANVTEFLLRESARLRPATVCCHANQLRQLLRYLAMRGLAEPGLAEAVPSVGRWRDAGIPRFPQRPAIERLLESCDRSRRVGVRDYAILMLLARLALRTIEVARLELDDLYWRAGEIEIDGKGRERARLPLPSDVGEALVDYLRLRGRHDCRGVFLTEHAPTRPIGAARGQICRARRVSQSRDRARAGTPSAARARQPAPA